MIQTKKGNHWHFGMKVHTGVDAEIGLIHTVQCTTAKVADIAMLDACLRREETITFGDRDSIVFHHFYDSPRKMVGVQSFHS